jgi:hypothetical protein
MVQKHLLLTTNVGGVDKGGFFIVLLGSEGKKGLTEAIGD